MRAKRVLGKASRGQDCSKEFAALPRAKPSQERKGCQQEAQNPCRTGSTPRQKSKSATYLKDNYGLTLEQITALYNFGKFQYTYGNYSGAADYLYNFRVLSTDTDLNTSAH